ncbi:MAG: SDR family oxidoreductase [Roseiflexaceae bacterium]
MSTQNRPPLIAVLGGTGTVGTEVLRMLAQRSCSVRSILRQPLSHYVVPPQEQPARVSYVLADMAVEAQLAHAMADVDALFLLVGTHPGQVETETQVIRVAQQVGVRRIIKLSAPVVQAPASVEVAHWHRAIEEQLAASGIEHCSLRPYAFMQNWLRNAEPIRQRRVITGSAGDAPRNYVDCRDVALVACDLLLSEQAPAVAALTLTGPESLTNREMAEQIALVSGAPMRYENLTREEHEQQLLKYGRLPPWLARHIVELEELALRIPEPATSTIAALLPRQPRRMNEFLYEHRAAFMPPDQPAPLRALIAWAQGR